MFYTSILCTEAKLSQKTSCTYLLKEKEMFVLIFFCISCINLIIADDISVSQFKFVGYKNVYYEGSDHQVSIILCLPGQIQPCRSTQNRH